MTPVDRYLLFGQRQIDGWLHPYTAEFIATLAQLQRSAGFSGSLGEIGVHHGKLFVLLLLTADSNEKAFAIDVFEDQALNLDGSGRGDRQIFEANIVRWAGSSEKLVTIAKSSLTVSPDEILTSCGKVRLASIDGGHTAECAFSDLKLIEAVMPDYGIAVLDDYFNEDWPDVSTGAARYFMQTTTRMRPFAIVPNKVFLATQEYNKFYRDRIAAETHFRRWKTSNMFGCEVDVFHGPPAPVPLGTYAREYLRHSSLGPYLASAKSALRRR